MNLVTKRDRERAEDVTGHKCDLSWTATNVAQALADTRAEAERDRDEMWCRVLVGEGTDVTERVTARFNKLRAAAQGGEHA